MLDVLLEDAHLLAVAKPAGVLTQGRIGGEPSLETEVRRYLGGDDPSSVYLGTVHRLDRPVSGVVLWAKTLKAARRLADQFAHREASKEYWAVVEGTPETEDAFWEDWLCADDTGLGVVQVCSPATPRARRAVTRVRREPAGLGGSGSRLVEGCSWLRLWPETGRTHQLRVQSSSRGLPIVGDRAYGSRRPFGNGGIALHARSLTVRHPMLDRPVTLSAPLPAAWESLGLD